MDLLFSSDILNLLLKTNKLRDRRCNFGIFVVWSALSWRVGSGGLKQKACLGQAKICFFVCSWFSSRMTEAG